MKKEFQRPEIEIIKFGSEDIITTSGEPPIEVPPATQTAKMNLGGYFK